jgi:NADH:ubiquinone oxidoreductase subunit 6 (subunit J)
MHIKAAWKSKRNKISGSLMVLVMSLLLISGLFLYYGADTRDVALWIHWIIGCGLVLLFPFHFIAGRRANYLAMKHPKKLELQDKLSD